MRNIIFTITFSALFLSCNNKPDSALNHDKKINTADSSNTIEIEVAERKPGKPYFDFDVVEHYFLDISEGEAAVLHMNENPSRKERELKEILYNNNLENISKLTEYGFKKTTWEKPKLKIAQKIFTENNCEGDAAACIAIFRDIYVFKMKGKIIGTVKVCFECRRYIIDGTKMDIENFGQGGDFEKLYKISR